MIQSLRGTNFTANKFGSRDAYDIKMFTWKTNIHEIICYAEQEFWEKKFPKEERQHLE
jgi:hypothetical protein